MPACVPTRHDRSSRSSRPPRASGIKRPHSPPPPSRGGRFRIAGADVSASITVFLLAVPMSLGLAVAMDAPLEAGLISAAVGGIVAGLLGGTPLQVSGPSAGLTVVTAELIQVYGWRTTCAITVGAGLLQMLLGSLRAARSALAVSPAIVHGTLAGIGVAIALAQLHIVLGGSPQSSAVANALTLPARFGRVSLAAPLIGLLTIAVLVLWPRSPGRVGRALRKLPAALAAVAIATAVASVAAPGIARVDLPSWRSHVLPEMPNGPVLALVTAVFTMMLVASLESLLAAVAVDKLTAERAGDRAGGRTENERTSGAGTGPRPEVPAEAPPPPVRRADLDRELRAQGIANVVSGLLGGLAVSGGAVRSSANVRAGATSRASTVLHGVWVLVATALLVTVLEWIPLAALAALVMMVGIKMVSLAHIRNVHRHREFPVYAATITGVVAFGVLNGVALGIAVAVVVALHRLARTRITVTEQDGHHLVTVRGQLTFLAVPRLTRTLSRLPQTGDAVVELDGFFMDHAAYETIQDWSDAQAAHGGRVVFTGRAGGRIAEPPAAAHSCCRPWTPWRNHHCHDGPEEAMDPRAGREPGPHAQNATACETASETAPLARPSAQGFGDAQDHRPAHAADALTTTGPGTPADPDPAHSAHPGQADQHHRAPASTRRPAEPGAAPRATSLHTDAASPGVENQADPRTDDAPSRFTTDPGDRTPPPADASPANGTGTTATATATTATAPHRSSGQRLVSGLSSFQRNTAPLVREELARLAREGQRPSQLFLTCADSRLVTSMITASGPGDLFTVRNVGNLVPPPDTETGDDSVAAAIEYAVDVLQVESITICGHSGCGAMNALLDAKPDTPETPLWRWLRHGLPSLERMASRHRTWARISGRQPADAVEQLCLTNVVQQLDHLRAHESVARRLAAGTLHLHGIYFHVAEAQAYVLAEGASAGSDPDAVFDPIGPGDPFDAFAHAHRSGNPFDATSRSPHPANPCDATSRSPHPGAPHGSADPGELERAGA